MRGLTPVLAVSPSLADSTAVSTVDVGSGPVKVAEVELVHLRVPTRSEAVQGLVELLLSAFAGLGADPERRFVSLTLGRWPLAVWRDGSSCPAGAPVVWQPADLDARAVRGQADEAAGVTVVTNLSDAAGDPGMVRLDWTVADSASDEPAAHHEVLDVTWEGIDGVVSRLDAVRRDRPLFNRPSSSTITDVVADLGEELRRAVTDRCWAEAAGLLYDLCRITDQHEAAVRLRARYDEPPARMSAVVAGLSELEQVLDRDRLPSGVVVARLAELEHLLHRGCPEPDRDAAVGALWALPTLAGDRSRVVADLRGTLSVHVDAFFDRVLHEDDELTALLRGSHVSRGSRLE
ncbi:hypothetical protein BH24ACT3_BH24ACT3_10400 [soil metagenome]